jgi:hypothetical protein
MLRFKFESETFLWFYAITLAHVEKCVCWSHGVLVIGATWRTVTRIKAEVGDLV